MASREREKGDLKVFMAICDYGRNKCYQYKHTTVYIFMSCGHAVAYLTAGLCDVQKSLENEFSI